MKQRAKQKTISFLWTGRLLCLAAILLLWLTVGSTKAFAAVSVPIDEEHFKDDTLRALVSESFDEDGDGILSVKEALRAKVLDCSGRKITSMDGIQYLSLTELYCSDCSLTELNLEGNTNLEKLDCSGNALTKLDIVPCTQLKVAHVQGNQISALEIWNARYLKVSVNQGTTTDQGTSILYEKMSYELCVDKAVQVISTSYGVSARPMIKEGDDYVESGAASAGEVYPEGILNRKYFGEGTTVVLTATANDGYEFVYWMDVDGNVISSETIYSFPVTENVDLWAVFEIAGNCYYAGDEFNSQGFYFYDDCYDEVIYSERNIKLQRFERHSADMEYWSVGYFKPSYLYLKTPKRRGLLETPVGFRIASGKGTRENPYHLELLYENAPLPETGTVTIGTKWYRGETVTSYSYFGWIDVTSPYGEPKYAKGRMGTTSNVVAMFFHEYVNSDEVIGVEVTAGEGTEKNPYHVAPLYSPEWLEGLNIPDLSGKVWAVGDTMELGDAYYHYYLNGYFNGHRYNVNAQHSRTGELNGKTIGEPEIVRDGEVYEEIFWGFKNIPLVSQRNNDQTQYPMGIMVIGGSGHVDSPYVFSIVWGVKDKVSVAFFENGGTGYMAPVAMEDGATHVVLPTCKFTAPEGKEFDCWEVTSTDGQVTYENAQPNEAVYVDRNMVCKAIWKEVVPHDENLVIAKKSLTLQDTIAIDFKIAKSAIEGKYHDPYLVVTQNGVETIITKWEPSDDGTLMIFSYRVAPHNMRDVVTAVPHALNADGEDVTGVSVDYSVTDYCYNMLGKATYQTDAWAPFRRLLVDILLYGDAAQTYKGYKTTELPSWQLTSAQRAMGTDVTVPMVYTNVKNVNFETVNASDEKAKIVTAALYLEASVNIQFKFTAEDLTGLKVVVTDGEKVLDELTPDPSKKDGNGRYYVTFGKLNAGQMRKTVYATVMQGTKKVSNTMQYSIESYAEAQSNNSTVPNLPELLHAMMRYGDSAKAVADMLGQ